MENILQANSQRIKTKALELGFTACGISKVRVLEEQRAPLSSWLSQGMNGTMAYMENHFEMRLDPAKIEEGAKSVISVLINYYPAQRQTDPEAFIISKYAYGKDYHLIVREKLNNLLIFIQTDIAPCRGRGFVDSAPVLDRYWAREAGLGWIGKNSLLLSKEHGSYFFIGELIIDLDLRYDEPFIPDYCGNCTRCLDACPTQAIIAPRKVDARKCISYHTIENKEEAPEDLRKNFRNRIFGCDICQDVCPWNKKLQTTQDPEFEPLAGLLDMTKQDWAELDREDFSARFRKSPFKRAGYDRLMRNISYVNKEN